MELYALCGSSYCSDVVKETQIGYNNEKLKKGEFFNA